METDEILERLLELKGKVPLSASDWALIDQALKDPALKNDLRVLELLDTLDDDERLQSSDDAAFLRLKAKINTAEVQQKNTAVAPKAENPVSWWSALVKPRKPWGLPVVLAQLALVAVYFNFGAGQFVGEDRTEIYRSAAQYDPCLVVKVKFGPAVTVEEVTEVLRKANLSIVGGPLSGNEYLVSRGAFTELELEEIFRELGVLTTGECKK